MMGFLQNTRKPMGLGGKIMLKMMNSGHAKLSAWGLAHLETAPDAKVLDIGCGGGANVAAFLAKCPAGQVTGVDYSELSVAKSRRHNAAAIKEGRCEICLANVSALPFAEARFDLVSAFETVYFWPTPVASFQEVHRVLKPHGRFMICNEVDGAHPADDKWQQRIPGMTIYPEKTLLGFLQEAGFARVTVYRKAGKHWICYLAEK